MTPLKPHEHHFNQVKLLWKTEGDFRFLRRVENFVYEGHLEGRPVILRLTEPKHRSVSAIGAELDWMDYLSKSGMRVAAPVLSTKNNLVETIDGAEIYHACIFEKAPGGPLLKKEEFTSDVFRTWGHYIGQMHSLTKKYSANSTFGKRSLWSEDSGFEVTKSGLEKEDKLPYQRFHEIMEWLGGLKKDEDCFGLIHADVHHGNFFVDKGKITAFDFDDSVYHWFSFDLAVPLFNLLLKSEEGFFNLSFEEIKETMIAGYLETNSIQNQWIDRIDLFLLFRMTTVYHWVKASMKAGVFDESALPWCHKVLPWCKKHLEAKIEFI